MIFSSSLAIAAICGLLTLTQARSISKRSTIDYTFRCSFETYDLCGMVQDVNDIFDWTIQRGQTESDPTGPDAAYDGEYYAYIETSYPRNEGDSAILILPDVFTPGQRYCMEFEYHMHGHHINELQLLFMSDVPVMPIWSVLGEQGNQWIHQSVELIMAPSFQLAFLGKRGLGYTGDIAIDDIHAWNGSCSDPRPTVPPTATSSSTTSTAATTTSAASSSSSTMKSTSTTITSSTTSTTPPTTTSTTTTLRPSTSEIPTTSKSVTATSTSIATGVTDRRPLPFFTCSFELDNGQPTFCDLEQSRSDDFDWSMRMGTTPSEPTGPREAASAPYYVYIEASSPRKQFDKALMMLPAYPTDSEVCVEFNYNMFGYHVNRLELGAINMTTGHMRNVWYLKGEQGPNWFHEAVTVQLRHYERLTFCATRGAAYSGDIALDDIEVYSGACGSVIPGSTPSSTQAPRTTPQATTPKINTTPSTAPATGTTAARTGTPPQSTGRTTPRQTTPPQATSSTLNPTGTPPQSTGRTTPRQTTPPQATSSTLNPTGTPPRTGTPSHQTTTGSNTTPRSGTPARTGTPGVTATTMRQTSHESTTKLPTTPTPSTPSTSSTVQTTTVPSDHTTTSDEEVVVNWRCDFETLTGDDDWCGIGQDQHDVFDWTLTDKPTPSSPTGPDSAWNEPNYIFIETSNPRNKGDEAMIRLPAMKATGQHCIEFQYHMYGHHINKLKVGVLHSPFMQFIDFVPLEIYSGDHGNRWIHSQVMVTLLDEQDQIAMMAVRGDEYAGDIALDAISVKTGTCQLDVPNQP